MTPLATNDSSALAPLHVEVDELATTRGRRAVARIGGRE